MSLLTVDISLFVIHYNDDFVLRSLESFMNKQFFEDKVYENRLVELLNYSS
jgi:hypothetical protein